jgi:hypothetical protein
LSVETEAEIGGPDGTTVKLNMADEESMGSVGLEVAVTDKAYVPGHRPDDPTSIVRGTVVPPAGTATGFVPNANTEPEGSPLRVSK